MAMANVAPSKKGCLVALLRVCYSVCYFGCYLACYLPVLMAWMACAISSVAWRLIWWSD